MSTESWLRTYVEQYGAICPLCRTPLRADINQCPRCRHEFRLGLKVVEAYLLAWGITLGALALQAGLGLFLLYLVLRRNHFHDIEYLIFLGVSILGVFALVGVVGLLAFRQLFCRWPPWVQWLIAAGALMLLTVGTMTMALVIFFH